ncbi:hypothetical protein DB345_14085 [Spartobacteria bacterium LR76]|nr:hypothetical protein DB345_14085 [Spartobacteria bacterium LR76]
MMRNTVLAAFAALVAACPLIAGDGSVVFKEDFSDGTYGENPTWTAANPNLPWTVGQDGGQFFVEPTGKIPWDSLRIAIPPLADRSFELQFDVRFRSEEVAGANRFFVILGNSEDNFRGYQLDIAQGTTNNCTLSRIGPDGAQPFAFISEKVGFPENTFVRVKWTRRADGSMSVAIDGQECFSVTDAAYSKFDRLTIGSVSPAQRSAAGTAFTQAFADIMLTAPVE